MTPKIPYANNFILLLNGTTIREKIKIITNHSQDTAVTLQLLLLLQHITL